MSDFLFIRGTHAGSADTNTADAAVFSIFLISFFCTAVPLS